MAEAAARPRREQIVRALSGEGPASRSNEQFRYLLDHGATGLDVIGDAPTEAFMDPDHPHARHAVGNQGVSICRAADFRALYDGIPLERVSVSHSLPSGFAAAGLYLAARDHAVDPAVLRGSAILGPLFVEDTGYAANLPLELHLRLACDSIEFCSEHMPRFHPFVEDTYYISDGSVEAVEEMALGFVEIREVVRRLVARGVAVDRFAPRIALLVNCRMGFFEEIAKIRASRRLYARMMRDEFGARDPRSLDIKVAAHTSGATMTSAQLVNNVVRGAIQTLALTMAGVRAMEISAFDEAVRTPSREAHIVSLRTQQIVALETDVADVEDPFAGSHHVEALTDELERAIEARVREIEGLGDIADLSSQGYFRAIFAEAMVDRAREIDDGSRPVVGVNAHRLAPEDDTLLRDIAEKRIEPYYDVIDEVRAWKAARDVPTVAAALDVLEDAARWREANLMPALVAALEADATMGECTGVMREAYGAPYDPLGGAERPR
ncbi:methylmalonyl-CoA mutase family protein [Capillimicrobium parvum]|uniref:Methylmalonyl-CoA mutase n=1 Tax=Capillimicrobium parvum TaxID=2884022 RepID=A0A9E6XZM7_9ACTN|nr:methylmalonyl-CoA mutase family protein [Capillimicrobium parvum]UGS36922.1 Methylmalonyl-CoA mutase [Capillimicrobium parvum]